MTTELDKVLLKQDRIIKVNEFWKSLGATDEQAISASATLAERFEWSGAVLSLNGKPATAEAVREQFGTNYGFLLPAPAATVVKIEVDPAVLAAAKAGNVTARGKLFVQVGRDQAKLDAVLAGGSADTGTDDKSRDDKGRFTGASLAEKEAGKNNPWTAANWNATKQSQIVRALGMEAAQRIAGAANSHVGATRPAKAA